MKSHAAAHAERTAAHLARVAVRFTDPRYVGLPYGRLARADALTFLRGLPEACADLCVTSPPYWAKRTYTAGDPDELGQERTPAEYVGRLLAVCRELARVLTPEGWLFLNVGDTYASQPGQYRGDPARARGISEKAKRANGSAPAWRAFDVPGKSRCLIPERLLLALVLEHGWRSFNTVAWHKLGHQPENVYTRLTQAWEPVLALTRCEHPYFDRAPGRADVWPIPVGRRGAAGAHPAVFPDELVRRIIRHACPPGGVVLDPFAGSGTTMQVAIVEGRRFLGCDLLAREACEEAVA